MDLTFLSNLMMSYWYLGAFVVGLLSSVSIFLPSPAFIVVFLTAPLFDPFLLGLAAGTGAALGEMTGYYAGRLGGAVIAKKYDKLLKDMEKNFEKYRPSLFIFLFALTPLPFDIVGIFCGVIRYKRRFFIPPVLAGKIIKYWAISYAGYYGVSWFMHYLA
ncbi:MAG: VTT domain-containing protein [archaeon]